MSAISNVDSLISALSGTDEVTYYIANNPLTDAMTTTMSATFDTPQVEAVYSNTMIYYLNLCMSITYVSVMPLIWFLFYRAGDYMTKQTIVQNIAWMALQVSLVVYSALLIVGSEEVQLSLLSSVFYIKGTIQALLLLNTTGFIMTILYWISTIEDRYSIIRNKLGQSAFDILTW